MRDQFNTRILSDDILYRLYNSRGKQFGTYATFEEAERKGYTFDDGFTITEIKTVVTERDKVKVSY